MSIEELQAIPNLDAVGIAVLNAKIAARDAATNGNTNANSKRTISLSAYGYFAGIVSKTAQDGTHFKEACYDLAHEQGRIGINVSDASVWNARLDMLAPGACIYLQLTSKTKGASYIDANGQPAVYRESGYLHESITPASKQVVERAFNELAAKSRIKLAREMGATDQDIVAALLR